MFLKWSPLRSRCAVRPICAAAASLFVFCLCGIFLPPRAGIVELESTRTGIHKSHSRPARPVGQRDARRNMFVCLPSRKRGSSLHTNHVVYLQLSSLLSQNVFSPHSTNTNKIETTQAKPLSFECRVECRKAEVLINRGSSVLAATDPISPNCGSSAVAHIPPAALDDPQFRRQQSVAASTAVEHAWPRRRFLTA